jgi:phenylacetic acid degradation operon negative regulatory protein
LWDLPGWAVRAEELTGDLERHQNDLVASPPEHLADGFLLDAAALRHLLADPLLPDELLPRDWPGGRLRRAQASYDEAFRRLWRQRFADR